MKENVLMLIQGFRQGGSESQMVQLTGLLHASGRYNVHVACLQPDGPLRASLDRLNIDIPSFPITSFMNRSMVTQSRRFAAYLREHKIDLIHTHDFYSNIFGLAGATLARVPVRIASKRETTGVRSPAQRLTELWAFRLADAIVVNAAAVRAHLLAEGVAAVKPVVIHNAVNLTRFPVDLEVSAAKELLFSRLPVKVEQGHPAFVTMVANMHFEVKGHRMLLRAARRVCDLLPNAVFLLIGEGKCQEMFQELAFELGLGNNVIFLGHRTNIPEFLQLSDVCVLSSIAEGFSNSILEYMASMKPVVATAVGGAPEAIIEAETGYLVNSGDDEAMADRILRLLKDPARARAMGMKGRQSVEERFSRQALVDNTERLYTKLLARRR